MAPLSRGRELLEAAVSYALADAIRCAPRRLSHPTPCPGWDLETLLGHVSESLRVLRQAVATGGISGTGAQRGHPGPGRDPVARLRGEAAGLLDACSAAGPGRERVAIGGRGLTAGMVAVTGALEITVHGWDISVACGCDRAVPEEIARPLDGSWTVRTCAARPRRATIPDGAEVTIHDTVLAAVRGSGPAEN